MHCHNRTETTMALDHLKKKQVAVPEAHKKLGFTRRWVHAFQETFKSLVETVATVIIMI